VPLSGSTKPARSSLGTVEAKQIPEIHRRHSRFRLARRSCGQRWMPGSRRWRSNRRRARSPTEGGPVVLIPSPARRRAVRARAVLGGAVRPCWSANSDDAGPV
jgi:hypothetical protein